MNIPNTLTLLRIVFSIAVFVFLAFERFDWALLLFVLASVTDFLDGWWARTFHQITVFGRIMDPFADKFLICGVFVCLVTIPALSSNPAGFPSWLMLQPWMVIVIVARELLITSLRAVVESGGGDFSAKWIGKWKMGLQCFAIIAALFYLIGGGELAFSTEYVEKTTKEVQLVSEYFKTDIAKSTQNQFAQQLDRILLTKFWRNASFYSMIAFLWLTMILTIYSGVSYSYNAAKMIGKIENDKKKE